MTLHTAQNAPQNRVKPNQVRSTGNQEEALTELPEGSEKQENKVPKLTMDQELAMLLEINTRNIITDKIAKDIHGARTVTEMANEAYQDHAAFLEYHGLNFLAGFVRNKCK